MGTAINIVNIYSSLIYSLFVIIQKASKYKRITDVDTLHRYINEEEEKEHNRSQGKSTCFFFHFQH